MITTDYLYRVGVQLAQAERQGYVRQESRFAAFGLRYENDPVGFVRECIDWRGESPSAYQEAIAALVVAHGRVAVRGPHGLGKSALAALLVLWFALTREALGKDWKIPTTASAWYQLAHFLWPEVHKWAGRLLWRKVGRDPFDERTEFLKLRLSLSHGEAFAIASDSASSMEGAHATELLYIYDEAKTIPDATFEATEGAFAGAGPETGNRAYALIISTPGAPLGRFYDLFAKRPGTEDWTTRAVTLEEAIDAKRVSSTWAEQRRLDWGETSSLYKNRVLGEFASDDAASVIPLSWVEAAVMRWREMEDQPLGPLTSLGVDVGGGLSTGDKSVIAEAHGLRVIVRKFPQAADPSVATMELAGVVHGILIANQATLRHVSADILGIGAGMVHRLREQRWRVFGFKAGAKTAYMDKSGELGFQDIRSASWWQTRELLDPAGEYQVALPPDDDLIGELTVPRYGVRSDGRRYVERKEDLKKRLGRSTDVADACIMALTGPAFEREAEAPMQHTVVDMTRRIGRY